MSVAIWDPRLETGIDIIDAQHKALFVADWLAHHIHEQDMGYVQFAQAQLKA